jgi:hypothetical protein
MSQNKESKSLVHCFKVYIVKVCVLDTEQTLWSDRAN